MSEADLNLNSSRSLSKFPRGKSHRQTDAKTTVGLYLPKTLVEKARKHGLNISRITEQALISILDYMENGKVEKGSLQNRRFWMAGPPGIEPGTYGLRASTQPRAAVWSAALTLLSYGPVC